MDKGGTDTAYYVDTVGFKELPDFKNEAKEQRKYEEKQEKTKSRGTTETAISGSI